MLPRVGAHGGMELEDPCRAGRAQRGAKHAHVAQPTPVPGPAGDHPVRGDGGLPSQVRQLSKRMTRKDMRWRAGGRTAADDEWLRLEELEELAHCREKVAE